MTALVAANLVLLIGGAIVDANWSWWDVAGRVLTLWITHALWGGKRWAYTLSFMLSTLCAGLLLLAALIQGFLLEEGVDTRLLLALVSSLGWIGLLSHPASRQFAGLKDDRSRPGTNAPMS